MTSAEPKGPRESARPSLDFPTAFPYRQHVDSCLAEHIGARGIARTRFDATLAAADSALARLRAREGSLAILRVAERRDDLARIEREAARLRSGFADIVVLGTGGSSLGGQSLVALRDQGFGLGPGAPRLHFIDNVDPDRFAALFEALDPGRTGFLAISKSGTTPETTTQLLICLAALSDSVGESAIPRHVTVITEAKDSPMRRMAARFGIPTLDHDPDIGGRYSALANVSLLPACIAGVDIRAVREGAAEVLAAMRAVKTAADCAPAVGAALAATFERELGIATTVIMPYADRLAAFGMWFRQLWAESLGKAGKGTTPARALGTVDQHSQLQLYLDGPADKLFTLVVASREGQGRVVPVELADSAGLAYIAGRSMGDLLAAEQRATYDTLAAAGRPVRVISIPQVSEATLGALFMHYMLEVILTADLLGVDPFDQPAVEDGKRRTRAYLQARRTEEEV